MDRLYHTMALSVLVTAEDNSEDCCDETSVVIVVTIVFDLLQIVKVTRTADIQFCKAFWGFSESSLMHVSLAFTLVVSINLVM